MSKMTWFKLHSEFRNDPKVKRLPIAERYAFIILLCLASEAETRGVITGLDDEDIAFELEMQAEDWKTLKAKFRVKGFIDFSQDKILIQNWDKRQYDKPSDHPEATKQRKRLQRERDKLAKSQDVTPCHADVTPMSPPRLEEIRSEEIRGDQIRVNAREDDFSQTQLDDRISKMQQAERDKWTSSEIDCKALAKDQDFRDYIKTVYLPSVPEYRGKEIEITQAMTWIVKGQRDPARRDLVEIQLEAFELWRSRQQKSAVQASSEPSYIPRPHPSTWTEEQQDWTIEDWQLHLKAKQSA